MMATVTTATSTTVFGIVIVLATISKVANAGLCTASTVDPILNDQCGEVDNDRKSCLEALLLETEDYNTGSDCATSGSSTCFEGDRTYNEVVLACNRLRDGNGVGKLLNEQFIDEHRLENDLPLRIIRGTYQFYGWANKMYHYLLDRVNGVWTITSVMEFELPIADGDMLHIAPQLADWLSHTADGIPLSNATEICGRDAEVDGEVTRTGLVYNKDGSSVVGCRVSRSARFFPLATAKLFRMPGDAEARRDATDWLEFYWRYQLEVRWSRPGFVNMKIALAKFVGEAGEIDADTLSRVRDADAVYRVDLHHNNERSNNMYRPIHIAGVDIYPGIYAGREGTLISHEFGHSLGLDDEYPNNDKNPKDHKDCDALSGEVVGGTPMRYIMCSVSTFTPKSVYYWIITQRYNVMGVCEDDSDCLDDEFCANAKFHWFRPTAKQCTSKKALGQACIRDGVCVSGICPGAPLGVCGECNDDTNCIVDEFCDKGGFLGFGANTCVDRRNIGDACSRDNQCASGHCPGAPLGVCSECTEATVEQDCDSDEFCDKGGLFGFGANTCVDRRSIGDSCSRDNQCVSGHCPGAPLGVCGECTEETQAQDCDSGEFCDKGGFLGFGANTCADKRALGESCKEDFHCVSGMCPGGLITYCAECLDDGDCGDADYCDKAGKNTCEPKRALGKACTRDEQCRSDVCPGGLITYCAACLEDSHCVSTRYCNKLGKNTCDLKKDDGESCSRDEQCATGHCPGAPLGVCGECTEETQAQDCDGGEFCDKGGFLGFGANTCADKLALGESCKEDFHCVSGMCPGGLITYCAECLDDADCGDTDYCDKAGKNTCEPKRALGKACTRDEQCRSDICPGGLITYCVACLEDSDCVSTRYCNKLGKNTCDLKKDDGESCSRDEQCQSNICPDSLLAKCAECERNSQCATNEYCDLTGANTCELKKKNGQLCSSDGQCSSGICPDNGPITYCAECERNSQCATNEYCDLTGANSCERKKNNGQLCSSDGQCSSGICPDNGPITYCAECERDNQCASNEYCDLTGANTCERKKSVGELCKDGSECTSGLCPNGVLTKCAECLEDRHCDSDEYCATAGVNECENKKSLGDACSSDRKCKSDCCKLYNFKIQCRPSDKCN